MVETTDVELVEEVRARPNLQNRDQAAASRDDPSAHGPSARCDVQVLPFSSHVSPLLSLAMCQTSDFPKRWPRLRRVLWQSCASGRAPTAHRRPQTVPFDKNGHHGQAQA